MSGYFYRLPLIFAIVLLVALRIPCYAIDEDPSIPWDFNNVYKENVIREEKGIDYSPLGYLLIQLVKTYQQFISPVKAGSCPMHPSCSAYSIEAIRKHGAVVGFVMTADRLLHESNEMDHAPLIQKDGTLKYFDPVDNNDFWWADKKE